MRCTKDISDGRHMAVGALEPKFYAELLVVLGLDGARPGSSARPHPWPLLRERIAGAVPRRHPGEWAQAFSASDACVAPVMSLREAAGHPHLKARGTVVEHDGVLQPAPAPRFSGSPTTLGSPPPVPGLHTADVLKARASAMPKRC